MKKQDFPIIFNLKIMCILIASILGSISSPIYAQWTTGLAAGNINAVHANGSTMYAGFNATGSLIISTDTGASWNYSATGLVVGSDVRAFASNSTTVYAGTTNGVYQASTSGTPIWTKILDNVSCFALHINGNSLYAGTMGGGVYRSTDGGSTWTQVNNGLSMLHVYALTSNGTHLFAGTYHNGSTNGQGVFRSSDNGNSWTAVNNGMPANTTIMSLAVAGGTLMAGTNGQGIYRSTDNGNNWTNVASGVVHTLHVVCDNTIYAGLLSHGGIITSTDNGLTWTAASTGLPNTGGYTVTSISSGNGYLIAGSLGGGISRMSFECPPAATTCITWNLLNSTAVTSSGNALNGIQEIIQGMMIFSNNPYTSNGQQLWMGNTGWPAGNLDLNRYVEFNSTVASGSQLTIQNVSFNYGDYTLTTDFNLLQFEAFYSTDNWTSSHALTTGPITYLNTTMQSFIKTGLNVSIASGQIFSVRIHPYAPLGSIAMTPTFAVHNNFSICGSTTDAVCTVTDTITVYKTVTDTLVIDLNITGSPGIPDSKNTIKAYPNPAKNQLTLDYGNFNRMSGYSIKVSNILGQTIYLQPIAQQQVSIDLSNWGGTGTYILNLLDPDQNIVETKKIILQ